MRENAPGNAAARQTGDGVLLIYIDPNPDAPEYTY